MLTPTVSDIGAPLPVSAAEFAALMAPLGPFGRAPHLGLAVSGGADSLCAALLAADWLRGRGGTAQAFIVDHGLRAGSDAEAREAAHTLALWGIPARILRLPHLPTGSALPARARAARFAAMETACRDAGIIDLLIGHHAADQAETVLMRGLRRSGPEGLAGMAAITETSHVRLLRPLLSIAPARLRAMLRARGIAWAEDPTNADSRFTRARIRAARADADGTGPATRALADAARHYGLSRHKTDHGVAAWLARHATLRPEGFALLPAGPWPPAVLARLLRILSGGGYPPPQAAVSAIAAAPAAAIGGGICLTGVRLLPARRMGPGFLLCREAAAMGPSVSATAGASWDGRFRRPATFPALPGEVIGALGTETRDFRDRSDLPAVVLETLPAYRTVSGALVAVPALAWPDAESTAARQVFFHPARPAAGAAFAAQFSSAGWPSPSAVMSPASSRHDDGDALHQKTSYL